MLQILNSIPRLIFFYFRNVTISPCFLCEDELLRLDPCSSPPPFVMGCYSGMLVIYVIEKTSFGTCKPVGRRQNECLPALVPTVRMNTDVLVKLIEVRRVFI